ncbi:hypothetical protein Golomagni_06005, partial [Golovinomyces magnicellulatus]
SLIGALECIAISVGPLLGGTLARYVGWRWCFWICLPIVGVTFIITTFFFHVDDAAEAKGLSLKQKLAQLDYTGAIFFLPGVVCLILALQWGGSVYAWKNWRIILLLVLFVVLLAIFAVTQWRQGDKATVPPSILGSRTVLFGSWYSFNTAGALYVASYYLPIWFQTSKHASPFESGVDGLPLMVSLIISIILSGSITSVIGYYNPTMCLGTVLMAIGGGLLTTLEINTSVPKWVIYQIVFALGCGFGFQQPIIATQAAFTKEQLPSALVIVTFMQTLGGIVAVSVAQNIFSNQLVTNLRKVAPNVDPSIIQNTGILDIKSQFTPEELKRVLPAYNTSITQVLTLSVAMGSATVIGALFIPWRSLKSGKKDK